MAARALVRDRGSQFVDRFDEIFRTEGVKTLKTPVRTPVANTFAERRTETLRRELLDRTIIWNRHQLERLVIEHVAHHNDHRPHRSLDQRPPRPTDLAEAIRPGPRIPRTTRRDGLINEYQNDAQPATIRYRAPTAEGTPPGERRKPGNALFPGFPFGGGGPSCSVAATLPLAR